jgi:hypothetical protein
MSIGYLFEQVLLQKGSAGVHMLAFKLACFQAQIFILAVTFAHTFVCNLAF